MTSKELELVELRKSKISAENELARLQKAYHDLHCRHEAVLNKIQVDSGQSNGNNVISNGQSKDL